MFRPYTKSTITLDDGTSMEYRPRTLEQTFLKASDQFPAVLVTGPRQVGKTSLLRHLGSERTYVTLDDPLLRDLAACRT